MFNRCHVLYIVAGGWFESTVGIQSGPIHWKEKFLIISIIYFLEIF